MKKYKYTDKTKSILGMTATSTIILVIYKIVGIINWNWLLVISPILFPAVFLFLAFIFIFSASLITALFITLGDKINEKKKRSKDYAKRYKII
jgi:hypothetical protein